MFSSSFPISTTAPPPSSAVRFRRPLSVTAARATATATRPPPGIATATSLYDVLGVQMGATGHEIKAAYRKLARAVHPDVQSDGQEEFIKVHAAYATLVDPNKRAIYDRTLIQWQRKVAPQYGYSRRSWETDQCW